MKVVISALNDGDYQADSGIYRSLQRRFTPDAFVEIKLLETNHGREILGALEKEAKRRLQNSQRDYIINCFENAGESPLYLKTAFEIARRWRSTDIAGKGRCVLAADTTTLITQCLSQPDARLSGGR